MRRLTPLVAALALGLAMPASASAADAMISSGPGLGVFFDIDEPSGVNQPDLEMVGVIAPAGPGCTLNSYHGTLFGKGDPAPSKCGWGKVISHDNRSGPVHVLAEAITFELQALRQMQLGSFKPSGGLIGDSRGELTETIKRLGQLYPAASKAARKIAKQVNKAKKLDAKANKAWGKGKKAKAKRLLKKANKIKRKQLKKMLKREKKKGFN